MKNQGRRDDQYLYSFWVSSISFILLILILIFNIVR